MGSTSRSDPRERIRHLAGALLAGLCRPRRAHRPGSGRPGLPPWRQDRRHRRQSPAALLDHARCPGPRRGSGARLPGFDRRRDALRHRPLGIPHHHLRGSGAGRQDPRDEGQAAPRRGGHLRRPQGHAALRLPVPSEPRAGAGDGGDLRGQPSGILGCRGGQGQGGGPRHHQLHLGDHGLPQGRDDLSRGPDRDRPELPRGRAAGRARRSHGLPAHGLDRRQLLLAGSRLPVRLHSQLSRGRLDGPPRLPRDRPDHDVRAASHLGEHPLSSWKPSRCRQGSGRCAGSGGGSSSSPYAISWASGVFVRPSRAGPPWDPR